jgi:hypothetical protein
MIDLMDQTLNMSVDERIADALKSKIPINRDRQVQQQARLNAWKASAARDYQAELEALFASIQAVGPIG